MAVPMIVSASMESEAVSTCKRSTSRFDAMLPERIPQQWLATLFIVQEFWLVKCIVFRSTATGVQPDLECYICS